MKKTIIALLLTGLLAGCGANGSNQAKDSSSSATKSSKVASKTKKDSSSKQEESSSTATSSSSSASASTASSSSSVATTSDHYGDVTSAAKKQVGEQWLPARVSGNAKYVNATASGSSSNSTVKFYNSSSAVDLNDASLQNAAADFTLTKKVYASTADAAAAINWIDSDSTLPTVDLGDNQTGTKQGAAGSTYLHWNEGNWSLTVRGSNLSNQDPTNLGKQLVEIFRTKSLPAPTTHGAAMFNMNGGADSQTISWNNGATVYTLTGSNAITTAETAVR